MLPKINRLTKKKDFDAVYKKGRTAAGGFLIFKFIKNETAITRVGFVVSKKVSNKAVIRNKTKRRLREAARTLISNVIEGIDLVIIARPASKDKSFEEIKTEIERLIKKAGMGKN